MLSKKTRETAQKHNKSCSPSTGYEKIAFIANKTEEAQGAYIRLTQRYGVHSTEDADIVVVLGGDGLMLRTAHHLINSQKPIYGMHCGSVGFLMNDLDENDLPARLAAAEKSEIHPLLMRALNTQHEETVALAINEVSLLRQTYQASKLRIYINNQVRMDTLICDGLLVATPAGSTAYNLSAHGTILPIDSPLLALTPLNPFRPRRWRGALLSNQAHIRIEVIEPHSRPVGVAADYTEVGRIASLEIKEDKSSSIIMLFDPGHNLDERILCEQFIY